jgi:ABC-type branched-subunit amino acid transport system substrate-binding protein
VSAASTSPSLTLGPFPVDAPKRVWPNYFRLVPNDLLQGDFAANYAFGRGGFRTAATVNDRDLYGQGLVTTFERRWRLLGAEITSSRSVAEDEPRLPAVAAAIARERPQVVYFGGQGTAAIQLASRLRGAGYDGQIMGGDAITSSDFIRKVRGADGTLATTVGGQIDTGSRRSSGSRQRTRPRSATTGTPSSGRSPTTRGRSSSRPSRPPCAAPPASRRHARGSCGHSPRPGTSRGSPAPTGSTSSATPPAGRSP